MDFETTSAALSKSSCVWAVLMKQISKADGAK